jgi:hypothetical protein
MWLLDVNMPRQLKPLLADLGIAAETANALGWGTLVNGDLLEAAAVAGYKCMLARDRLFGESASRYLKQYPSFAIVIVMLPQFLASFKEAWENIPIVPVPGQVQTWP